MDEETTRALNELNLAFYRERAEEFSRTREHPWPGWERLLPLLPAEPLRVLDIGCGNGRFGRFLETRRPGGRYVGVDASEPLLEKARDHLPVSLDASLHRADFVSEAPDAALPPGPFSLVVLFGVLHGVPGASRRRALVAAAAQRLARGGILALAAWRFAELEDLRRRIVPWSGRSSIDTAQLEPGDHLLAWGGIEALRYAHALDEHELAALTGGLGLIDVASFVDDGRGRERNRYAILRAA
jgi:SAM-dependent methyltransferase